MAMAFGQKSEIMASGIWEIYTVFYILGRRRGESFSIFSSRRRFLFVLDDKEGPPHDCTYIRYYSLPASGFFPWLQLLCPV